jgi:hypothetical protein
MSLRLSTVVLYVFYIGLIIVLDADNRFQHLNLRSGSEVGLVEVMARDILSSSTFYLF